MIPSRDSSQPLPRRVHQVAPRLTTGDPGRIAGADGGLGAAVLQQRAHRRRPAAPAGLRRRFPPGSPRSPSAALASWTRGRAVSGSLRTSRRAAISSFTNSWRNRLRGPPGRWPAIAGRTRSGSGRPLSASVVARAHGPSPSRSTAPFADTASPPTYAAETPTWVITTWPTGSLDSLDGRRFVDHVRDADGPPLRVRQGASRCRTIKKMTMPSAHGHSTKDVPIRGVITMLPADLDLVGQRGKRGAANRPTRTFAAGGSV